MPTCDSPVRIVFLCSVILLLSLQVNAQDSTTYFSRWHTRGSIGYQHLSSDLSTGQFTDDLIKDPTEISFFQLFYFEYFIVRNIGISIFSKQGITARTRTETPKLSEYIENKYGGNYSYDIEPSRYKIDDKTNGILGFGLDYRGLIGRFTFIGGIGLGYQSYSTLELEYNFKKISANEYATLVFDPIKSGNSMYYQCQLTAAYKLKGVWNLYAAITGGYQDIRAQYEEVLTNHYTNNSEKTIHSIKTNRSSIAVEIGLLIPFQKVYPKKNNSIQEHPG